MSALRLHRNFTCSTISIRSFSGNLCCSKLPSTSLWSLLCMVIIIKPRMNLNIYHLQHLAGCQPSFPEYNQLACLLEKGFWQIRSLSSLLLSISTTRASHFICVVSDLANSISGARSLRITHPCIFVFIIITVDPTNDIMITYDIKSGT